MTGDVVIIKVYSPHKLGSGLSGKYNTICHYSYNLPLYIINFQRIEFAHEMK